MEFKAKRLHATVTIELEAIEADAQLFQTYDLDKMVIKYKEELESEFNVATNEYTDSVANNVTAKVEVKDG